MLEGPSTTTGTPPIAPVVIGPAGAFGARVPVGKAKVVPGPMIADGLIAKVLPFDTIVVGAPIAIVWLPKTMEEGPRTVTGMPTIRPVVIGPAGTPGASAPVGTVGPLLGDGLLPPLVAPGGTAGASLVGLAGGGGNSIGGISGGISTGASPVDFAGGGGSSIDGISGGIGTGGVETGLGGFGASGWGENVGGDGCIGLGTRIFWVAVRVTTWEEVGSAAEVVASWVRV
jgi:hypothetical protein